MSSEKLLAHGVKQGYWCVVCGKFLPADEQGVIVHDEKPHPGQMTFDEEENSQ